MGEFFEPLFSLRGVMSLISLVTLEIVLGIDNIIFVSILSSRLRKEDQQKARLIGLGLALLMRIFLLTIVSIIIGFSKPIINDFFGLKISFHDIILVAGGLFLIYKSTDEIHEKLEGVDEGEGSKKVPSLTTAIIQIIFLDVVFSFDSILTAIGLVDNPHKDLIIMIIAVIVAVVLSILFSQAISGFIEKHPTVRMLALSFLLMIGVLLVAEGFHVDVPKGYIYFSMTFSLFVEALNMRARKKKKSREKREN